MELTNSTILRGCLAQLRSKVREMAALQFEYREHPDSDGAAPESPAQAQLRKMWGGLRTDLRKVIGVEIVPWNKLASRAELIQTYIPPTGARNQFDPLRITMGALKDRADKARFKDPDIMLLKSWDKAAKEAG